MASRKNAPPPPPPPPPRRGVREPVQVYLDREDRELLERVARAQGWSRAEVLRRGLRGLASQGLAGGAPGGALISLVGLMGDGPGMPADLAAGHDRHLLQADEEHERRSRVD